MTKLYTFGRQTHQNEKQSCLFSPIQQKAPGICCHCHCQVSRTAGAKRNDMEILNLALQSQQLHLSASVAILSYSSNHAEAHVQGRFQGRPTEGRQAPFFCDIGPITGV